MSNTGLVPRKVNGERYGGSGKKRSASRSATTDARTKLSYATYHRPKRKEEPLEERHLPWAKEREIRKVEVDLGVISGLCELAVKRGKGFHAGLYRKFLACAERYVGKSGSVVVTVIGYAAFPRNTQAGEFKKVKVVNDTCALPVLFLEHAKEMNTK